VIDNHQNKILSIRPINQLFALRDVLIRFIISIGAIIILNFDPIAILCFGLLFLSDALPALYLHNEYFTINRKDIFKIQESEIIHIKGDNQTIINIENIENITFYMSPSAAKESEFFFFSMECYYFASINLKSGKTLILTSLLSLNLIKSFDKLNHIHIEKNEMLFCNINKL